MYLPFDASSTKLGNFHNRSLTLLMIESLRSKVWREHRKGRELKRLLLSL